MTKKTTPFDAADYLSTPEDRADYLNAILYECDGDPAMVLSALGDIARSVGLSNLAERTGLTRQGLHKSLSPDGNPRWETVWRVADELGLEIIVRPKAAGE